MEQIRNYLETMKEVISSDPLFFITFFVIATVVQSLAIHKSAKSTGAESTFLKGLSALLLYTLLGTIAGWSLWILEAQLDVSIPLYIQSIIQFVIYGLSIKLVLKVSFGHALMIWIFSLILLFVWFIIFGVLFILGNLLYWRIAD